MNYSSCQTCIHNEVCGIKKEVMHLQKEIEYFVKNKQVNETVNVDVTCRHYRSPFSNITYASTKWDSYNSLTGIAPVMDNNIATISSSNINSITTDSNSSFKIETNDTDNTATINKTEG